MSKCVDKAVRLYTKYKTIWKALVMSCLPLLCCILACAVRGRNIADVYLPAGEWNDELFYFKQVEGIVNFGYPQGYFGFNESHALKASFAAWSPVLVFPWIIWGMIFGWNLLSPIYCNIFLMMLSMFLFVWLVKPNKKQLGILTILYVTFTPLTRYMLSGMPECICFAMVITVLALIVSYQEKEHSVKLVLLFVMTSIMTLMRPYLFLFMVLPAYYWIRRRKWWGALGSVTVMGVTGAIYVAVKHFFGAEYFTPLFDVTWVTTFLDEGFFAGIKFVLWKLVHGGMDYCDLMVQGIKSDLFWGEYFVVFMVVMAVVMLHTLVLFYQKKRTQCIFYAYCSLCFVGMWAALLLMYKMQEGSKHLLTFIVAGFFMVCLMETRFFKKMVVIAFASVFLFVITPVDSYEHQIPFADEELLSKSKYWEQVFDEECELVLEDTPNFDNVIIWVFNEPIGRETAFKTYQFLYQLPEGMGISCCYTDYVKVNPEQLRSRYLAVVSAGEIDQMCKARGFREIGRDEGMVVYELYGAKEG